MDTVVSVAIVTFNVISGHIICSAFDYAMMIYERKHEHVMRETIEIEIYIGYLYTHIEEVKPLVLKRSHL